ncbi:MAG: hypothetical protein II285_04660 [Flavobacteriales bacterium]|nr:hypothetical protein [Flavobacteriales bacterium]
MQSTDVKRGQFTSKIGIILASATTTRLSRPAAACSISARGIKNGRTGPSRCVWKEV